MTPADKTRAHETSPQRFAVVTLAAHDFIGFVGRGRITEAQFRAAPAGPKDIDADHSIILDLWDETGVIE